MYRNYRKSVHYLKQASKCIKSAINSNNVSEDQIKFIKKCLIKCKKHLEILNNKNKESKILYKKPIMASQNYNRNSILLQYKFLDYLRKFANHGFKDVIDE
jgi:hypothetical protein